MAITALPTPPTKQDPINFAIRADTFLSALVTFATEANALQTDVNTKQSAADTSATAAAGSKTAAATSATAAATSATAAATALDSFTDIYLGPKSSAPTLDNDSNPIAEGAIYWNSAAKKLYIRSGAIWDQAGLTMIDGITFAATDSSNTAGKIVIRDLNGNFAANVISAVDFNSTSDITLKENIKPLDGISLLKDINPVQFTWKDSGSLSYGVIAQELQKVLPNLVTERDDKILTVNYVALIGVLVDAVQKLDARVKQLESK